MRSPASFASPVVAPSVTLRRAAALAAGGFDERLRVSADLTMWMALAAAGDVAYLAEPLVRSRRRGAFANDHAAVDWDVLGEHVAVGTATQLAVHHRLGLAFRMRRTAYLAQFVGRDALEPARGDRAAVLRRHGSPALRAAAPLARPAGPLTPALRAARAGVRAAQRVHAASPRLRGA